MTAPRGIVPFALALTLAAGCASGGLRPEVLQRWIGRPAALEKDWGTATPEVPDGERRIPISKEVEQRSGRSGFDNADPARSRGGGANHLAAHEAANQAYRTPTVYVRSTLFWVNHEGTIVHSAVRTP